MILLSMYLLLGFVFTQLIRRNFGNTERRAFRETSAELVVNVLLDTLVWPYALLHIVARKHLRNRAFVVLKAVCRSKR